MKKLHINFALFNRLFAGKVRNSQTSRYRLQEQNVWLFPKPVKRKFLKCLLSELMNKDECMSLYNDNQLAIS